MPPDATSGPITIVTPHGQVTSTAIFKVLPPPLSIVRSDSGDVEVRWPAVSDAFVLEAAEDLATGGWVPVAQAPLRLNDQSAVSLVPGGTRFYRLVTR